MQEARDTLEAAKEDFELKNNNFNRAVYTYNSNIANYTRKLEKYKSNSGNSSYSELANEKDDLDKDKAAGEALERAVIEAWDKFLALKKVLADAEASESVPYVFQSGDGTPNAGSGNKTIFTRRNKGIAGGIAALGLLYANRDTISGIINKTFKSDAKNHALEELVKNPQLFDTMNPNYTNDPELCLSAISKNIDVFNHMNNNLIKNEEFLLKAIILQNNILSLMVENEEYNEILKKPSFINKLKTIENGNKEFKKLVESLEKDLDSDSDNNSKKDSRKKRTPEKKNRTFKKNTRY